MHVMHTKMKRPLQNSWSAKLQMRVKIMFTKRSSEINYVIGDMIPSLGAVAVTMAGGEDSPVMRYIVRHLRGDVEVLRERGPKIRGGLCRKVQCACAHCEKTLYTAKRESARAGGVRG